MTYTPLSREDLNKLMHTGNDEERDEHEQEAPEQENNYLTDLDRDLQSIDHTSYLADGLTPLQARFLIAFLSSSSVAAAAKEVGINEHTAHAWLDNPRFLPVFQRVQSRLFNIGIGQLQNLTLKAIRTLEASLDSPQERYRIRASELLLEHAIDVQAARLMEEKIEALERKLSRLLGEKQSVQTVSSIKDYL